MGWFEFLVVMVPLSILMWAAGALWNEKKNLDARLKELERQAEMGEWRSYIKGEIRREMK